MEFSFMLPEQDQIFEEGSRRHTVKFLWLINMPHESGEGKGVVKAFYQVCFPQGAGNPPVFEDKFRTLEAKPGDIVTFSRLNLETRNPRFFAKTPPNDPKKRRLWEKGFVNKNRAVFPEEFGMTVKHREASGDIVVSYTNPGMTLSVAMAWDNEAPISGVWAEDQAGFNALIWFMHKDTSEDDVKTALMHLAKKGKAAIDEMIAEARK